jgi:hypothetical protein
MTAPLRTRAQARARATKDNLLRLRQRGVHARLAALEEEMQESRQLNRRITELIDVVAELLVPLADRDDERVDEVLEKYRKSII